MKYIKPNMGQIYILNPLIFLAGLIFFWKLPTAVHYLFYLTWLPTIAVITTLVLPISKQYLGKKSATGPQVILPPAQWLTRVLVVELTLIGTLLGICYLTGSALPINTTSYPHLFTQTLHTQLIQLGLFPWALYSIAAVFMGKMAYNDHTDAYFSNLFKSITKQTTKGSLSLIINTGVRRCNIFSIAVILSFLSLLLLSLLTPPSLHFKNGFQPTTLLTTLSLFIIFYTNKAKAFMQKLFSRQISTRLSLPIFSLLLAALIGFLSVTFHGLYHTQTKPLQIPTIITDIIHRNWLLSWETFVKIWMISMTPIVGIYFAKISRGYRIRTVIAGTLALPLLLAAATAIPAINHIQWPTLAPWLEKTIAIISMIVLLPALLNHRTSSMVTHCYFPKDGKIKHRDHIPFFIMTTQITAVMLYFFLVIGMNGLSLFFFSTNTLILFYVPIIAIAFFAALKQHK